MMKELRSCNQELRVTPESRIVEGYAIVFNSESNDLGGFREVIDSRALDGVISCSDILCLLNHNEDKGVLARSKFGEGSLSLEIDERGLKYMFEAPKTALGDELLEGLKRGDITTSSFAFTVGKDNWEKREDGSYLRTIVSIQELYDVSPVYFPAYSQTSVKIDQRCLDKIKEMKDQEQKELDAYYKQLRDSI